MGGTNMASPEQISLFDVLGVSTYQMNSPVLAAIDTLAASNNDEDRGAVFTRAEVVEFILDLVGYDAEEKLYNKKILEPSTSVTITVCTSCSSIQMRQNFFSLFISFIFLTPSYFNLLSVSLFLYPSLAAVAAIWPAREDTNDLILVISDI
jgi:hypothetical protein